MKKIGIISDTHSYWDPRYAEHFKDCDEIWHAGDIGSEAVINRLEALVPKLRAVYGNADGGLLRRRWSDEGAEESERYLLWVLQREEPGRARWQNLYGFHPDSSRLL